MRYDEDGGNPRVPITGEYIHSILSTPALNQSVLQHTSTSIDDAVWIYYQNVRGLRTKLDNIFLTSLDCGYDVILLTETGLNDSINSLQIFGSSYNVFRCDRCSLNRDNRNFGGVLIAVANRHVSTRIDTLNGNRLEQVRDVVLMEDHIATVRELSVSANSEAIILACGDYNQPRLAWSNDDNSLRLDNPILLTPASAALIDGMDFLNMNQINAQLNHLRRTLDLVFVSEGSHAEVLTAVDSLVSVDPNHPPLTIRFNAPAKSVTSLPVGNVEERKINYRKIDFDSLSAHLSGSDWSCIYDCTNVHDMAFKFCDIIRQWLIANVPLKRCPISPPWSTPLLRRAKRVRNQWQRRMRTHRSNFTKVNFKHASDDYRHLNAALYKSHVLRVQFGLRRDPKSFWNFNRKRKNPIVSSNLVYEDKESSD
ncbi:uncharacterized protein LOC129761472 [Toxorhynchites rutilus septentrionalis]|uniref:uncharacterized protein LOC129761472 n=1 Tax=Toxorhynchites rutilus septentrionalis TaxID=329112 RepID=UPI002478C95D|nr:uncharacterized protein LOC129761472 [Toxorhynchites rutilus septentrionalis]